jgi:hypothetical protein
MSDNYDPSDNSAASDSSADSESSATSDGSSPSDDSSKLEGTAKPESSAKPKDSTVPDDSAAPEKLATSDDSSPSDEDAVGYKRPPKEHQFQKGCSGNPNGRPKDKKSLFDKLEAILNELVTVVEDGERKRVTKLEAMIMRLLAKALSGDLRALTKVLELRNQMAPPEKKFGAEGQVLVKNPDARERFRNRLQRLIEAARAEGREEAEARREGSKDDDSDTKTSKNES